MADQTFTLEDQRTSTSEGKQSLYIDGVVGPPVVIVSTLTYPTHPIKGTSMVFDWALDPGLGHTIQMAQPPDPTFRVFPVRVQKDYGEEVVLQEAGEALPDYQDTPVFSTTDSDGVLHIIAHIVLDSGDLVEGASYVGQFRVGVSVSDQTTRTLFTPCGFVLLPETA